MDKNLFLKNMEEMIAIAKTNGNQIDHKELLDYFSDYNLNEEAKKLDRKLYRSGNSCAWSR